MDINLHDVTSIEVSPIRKMDEDSFVRNIKLRQGDREFEITVFADKAEEIGIRKLETVEEIL